MLIKHSTWYTSDCSDKLSEIMLSCVLSLNAGICCSCISLTYYHLVLIIRTSTSTVVLKKDWQRKKVTSEKSSPCFNRDCSTCARSNPPLDVLSVNYMNQFINLFSFNLFLFSFFRPCGSRDQKSATVLSVCRLCCQDD